MKHALNCRRDGTAAYTRWPGLLGAFILVWVLVMPALASSPPALTPGIDSGAPSPAVDSRFVAVGGANGGNNCLSSVTPCATIQHAIDVAGDGDEILIGGGTYAENLVIPKPLALHGGHDPVTWTRDLDLYPTIIDGSRSQPMPGDWDGRAVGKASVIRDNTVFKMWYDGSNLVGDVQIGLAASANGTAWNRSGANPVLTGTPGTWDEFASERAPFILKEGGLFKMWYESGEPRQLGYATSADGVHWTKHPGNPILLPGPAGYDQDTVGHGAVLHEGVYKLWYHAIGDEGPVIAYATSPDGINWTKQGPVLHPDGASWDDGGLWGPSVIRYQGLLHMWYSAFGSATVPAIGLAVSSDGINWTRINLGGPVLAEAGPIGDPHVLLHGSILKMWYTDYEQGVIKYAQSTDGVNWTPAANNPVLTPGGDPGQWGEPVIRFEDGSDGSVLDGLRITGGQSLEAGGVHAATASISIIHCRIHDNFADGADDFGGGAVLGAFDQKTLTIEDSVLLHNGANSGASAVRAHLGALNMVNVLVARNHAANAPVLHLNGTANLTNVTIADNGAGVLHNPPQPLLLTVRNSIIYGHDWAIGEGPDAVVEVGYSDIEDGWPGTGNIDDDPRFKDPDLLNYHLSPTSPAVDSASNAWMPDHDIEGDPRPLDGNFDGVAIADMGADEYRSLPVYLPLIFGP